MSEGFGDFEARIVFASVVDEDQAPLDCLAPIGCHR